MDLASHLADRLLFAIPKKGRLNQACVDLLSGSDIRFSRNPRLDIALVRDLPLALVFLPAADIPTFVGEGRVDLGITGRDQVAEYEATPGEKDPTHGVEQVLDLDFGGCKLQVQVPEKGNIDDSKQLVGKNIVTSFTNLAEKFFCGLENVETAAELKTSIKYVGGSVEAACALGVADGIVDLVESGETMRAAGLKAIETVQESTAVLIKSRQPTNEKLVRLLTSRIEGVITAQKYVSCMYNIPRDLLQRVSKITPGRRAPTVNPLEENNWVAVHVMVKRKEMAVVMDQLSEIGARDILITKIDNSRGAS